MTKVRYLKRLIIPELVFRLPLEESPCEAELRIMLLLISVTENVMKLNSFIKTDYQTA